MSFYLSESILTRFEAKIAILFTNDLPPYLIIPVKTIFLNTGKKRKKSGL
jgi:hypothetical protein